MYTHQGSLGNNEVKSSHNSLNQCSYLGTKQNCLTRTSQVIMTNRPALSQKDDAHLYNTKKSSLCIRSYLGVGHRPDMVAIP